MERLIVPIKGLLLPILLAWASLCWGQRFELNVESNLTGTLTLTVYDGLTSSHSFEVKDSKGLFYFSGNVEAPVAAMLQHPAMKEPLYLFIEPSSISIQLNASRPGRSIVKGSRSSSEYRYLMECYYSASSGSDYLRDYIAQHPSSVYVPLVLYNLKGELEEGTLRRLVSQMEGAATKTYHYTMLQERMQQQPVLVEGVAIPDIEFCDSTRHSCRLSQKMDSTSSVLLVVGARWCDICQQQMKELPSVARNRAMQVISINIDDSPAGWNAPFLKTLGVDHVPYLILIDRDGKVLATDLRAWEVEEEIKR